MDHGENPIAHSIDISTPSIARMYDWFLGGTDNFPSDRKACRALLDFAPSTRVLVRNNRLFLQRVVRVLAQDYGVRQFLDYGSGLPVRDNVHQVAQGVDASSRVVYIDDDPIVFAHGRTLLDENDETAIMRAKMTDIDGTLDHLEATSLINLDAPVAALFVSGLHRIPDPPGPESVIQRVASRLATGSFLVFCQLVSDNPALRQAATEFMLQTTGHTWGRVRDKSEVHAWISGMQLLAPGLVEVSAWRPDSDLTPRQRTFEWEEYGGVICIP
ncbi:MULTISPECIES: SAM-dependent methyltransferase [Streptomyces]|uniref:SAM-dependent methyltransferase n=1 Tax=Streptomyces yatensis TaxID=155177 RepID=A0ABP4VNE6_9ACTN|nr:MULTISPECIES: SAM-dependent methyltransferase [Streptomyces]MCG0284062.1 SAM-dependent methyltransferase [Streptomyces sp. PSAA01]